MPGNGLRNCCVSGAVAMLRCAVMAESGVVFCAHTGCLDCGYFILPAHGFASYFKPYLYSMREQVKVGASELEMAIGLLQVVAIEETVMVVYMQLVVRTGAGQ